MIKQRTRVAIMAVAAMVAAGCGSTLQSNRQASAGSETQLTTSPDSSAGEDVGQSEIATSPGGQTAGAGSSAGPTATPAPAAATNTASGRQGPLGKAVRGLTDKTITIGIGTVDYAAITQAFAPGADTSDSPPLKDLIQAVVDAMNKHGGIAGRQINALYYDFPVNDLVDDSARPRREQAMCDDFTIDRPAFAAIPLETAEGVFNNCAAERDLITMDIGNLGENVDDVRYREIQNVWYRPDWMVGNRREKVVVAELQRRGFFTKGAKVGVMLEDFPAAQRTYTNTLLPALKAIGMTPVATSNYRWNDNGQSAVLKFKAAGVDHVMWGTCSCSGLAQATFMNAADSQAYHPLYALTSDLDLSAISGTGGPAGQIQHSIAFGWSPGYDGVTLDNPQNESAAFCLQADKDAGYNGAPYSYCDGLFLLKAGLEKATELTSSGFHAAVEKLGSSYVPASTFTTSFGPGRHDGVSSVREIRYESDCSCWRYRGGLQPVG